MTYNITFPIGSNFPIVSTLLWETELLRIKITFPNDLMLCLHVKNCFRKLLQAILWIYCWVQLSTHHFIVCYPLFDNFLFCNGVHSICNLLNFSFTTCEMKHDYYCPVFLTKCSLCQYLWKKPWKLDVELFQLCDVLDEI